MNSKPAQRFCAWLCLLLFLSASAVGGRGFVLCFDPDGHVALEVSSGADCNGCASDEAIAVVLGADDSQQPDEQLGGAPACPCSDIALPVTGIAHKRAVQFTLELPTALASTMHTAWDTAPVHRAGGLVLQRDADANRASLTRARSTVLLI